MKMIALVSYKKYLELGDGELLLKEALVEKGYDVMVVSWDDPEIDWTKFDMVVLRAMWDYHTREEEFRRWLEKLELERVKVWNSVKTVKWNMDKHYLKDLEAKGVDIIPTKIIDRGSKFDLESLIAGLETKTVIVKPTIGAGSYGVEKFRSTETEKISECVDRLLQHSDVILQKFMEQISTVGEYSLMFFGKEYSHAVLKTPSRTDFRSQPHYGGSEHQIVPDVGLISQAEKVVVSVESPLLYARVDGIDDHGTFRVMELELTEPYLFFDEDLTSAGRFVEEMEKLF